MVSRRFRVVLDPHHRGFLFLLGVFHARADATAGASYDAKLDAIRAEVRSELGRTASRRRAVPAGTSGADHGQVGPGRRRAARARRAWSPTSSRSCRTRWACCRCSCFATGARASSSSIPTDNLGKTNYGTAGYLGGGYFVTVKHAVVALKDDDDRAGHAKIASIKVMYKGKEIPARLIDAGDADVEVHSGDWAIIKTQAISICRALQLDTGVRATTSPSRSSGSATTTRRASSSRPATSASGRRTAWSPASPTAIPACPAAACSISAATWSASRSAGCRATTASRSSCRFAPRCCASCRPTSRPSRCRPVLSSPNSNAFFQQM